MFLNLFNKEKKEEPLMNCPKCCCSMSANITGKDRTEDYHEIRRQYRCDTCGLEYTSIEMIAPDSELESIKRKIFGLSEVVKDFGSNLNILKNAIVKLNATVVRNRNGGQGMN